MGFLAWGGASWTSVKRGYSPFGVGTLSPTTTWKREKGAPFPLRQRANETINSFGLRVPFPGTHYYRKGQPALICQTKVWLSPWTPQPVPGTATPTLAIATSPETLHTP